MGVAWLEDGEKPAPSLGFWPRMAFECTLASYGLAPTQPQFTLPPHSLPQQLNAVIAASMSIKSSDKLRQILEVSGSPGQGSGR